MFAADVCVCARSRAGVCVCVCVCVRVCVQKLTQALLLAVTRSLPSTLHRATQKPRTMEDVLPPKQVRTGLVDSVSTLLAPFSVNTNILPVKNHLHLSLVPPQWQNRGHSIAQSKCFVKLSYEAFVFDVLPESRHQLSISL